MSVDYTRDYSNHTLLDNQAHYSKIYKLDEIQASDGHKGDLILLKTPCGQYRLYIATGDSDEDNTLHLSRYSEIDFFKADSIDRTKSVVLSSSDPCGYTYEEDDSGTYYGGGGSCGC